MLSKDEKQVDLDSPIDNIASPNIESTLGEQSASGTGRMVAVPGIEPDRNGLQSKADMRAERQMLTGRAAQLSTSVGKTPSQLAWRRMKKNKLAMISLVVLAFMYATAIFAQFIAPYDFAGQDKLAQFRPPIAIHWTPYPIVYTQVMSFDEYHDILYNDDKSKPHRIHFFVHGEPYKFFGFIPTDRHLFGVDDTSRIYVLGTDQFGRDYFTRILFASQISLSVGLIGISLTLILGLLVGGISGFYGGVADDIIMRLCEVVMSVPDFYLLLALAAALPLTLPPLAVYFLIIGILSLTGFAGMARIIRGMVLSVREREYVEAARALGVSDFKIIVRHIIPSTYTFAIITATLSIPGFILSEAALSFLGLGIRDPLASWGNMLSEAQDLSSIEERLWLLTPGVLIFIATLAFNFLGDGLRDALDPKSK